MELDRFNSITNRRVNYARAQIINKIYEDLNNNHKHKAILDKSSFKKKYLKKLLLCKLEELDEEVEEVKQVKELTCNDKWPMCLFDHTRKYSQPTFFIFKVSNPFEVKDNYFTKGDKAPIKDQKHETDNDIYESLLIERSPHYCTNKEFAERINYMLKQDKDVDNVLGKAYENVIVAEEKDYIDFMDEYVKTILACNLNNASKT